ncbi:hypothetical protein Tco_1335815 [Tanacetum coccineum]
MLASSHYQNVSKQTTRCSGMEREKKKWKAEEQWDVPSTDTPLSVGGPTLPLATHASESESEAEARNPMSAPIGTRADLIPFRALIQIRMFGQDRHHLVKHIEEEDVRADNKRLKMMLDCSENRTRDAWRENDRATWHYHHLRRWSITVENLLPPRLRYQEPPYALPETLLAPVTHNDPRDPYVAARDAATAPTTDDDDSPTPKETAPSEPQGSPPRDSYTKVKIACYHTSRACLDVVELPRLPTMGLEALTDCRTEMKRIMTDEFCPIEEVATNGARTMEFEGQGV